MYMHILNTCVHVSLSIFCVYLCSIDLSNYLLLASIVSPFSERNIIIKGARLYLSLANSTTHALAARRGHKSESPRPWLIMKRFRVSSRLCETRRREKERGKTRANCALARGVTPLGDVERPSGPRESTDN